MALVTSGSVRLKGKENSTDLGPVDPECRCSTCRNYSRAVLHVMFKEGNALAAQLLTKHNVSYMMRLMRTMRQAIMEGHEAHEQYVRNFFAIQFPQGDVPFWAVEALATADIHITTTLTGPSDKEKGVNSGGDAAEEEVVVEGSNKKVKVDETIES